MQLYTPSAQWLNVQCWFYSIQLASAVSLFFNTSYKWIPNKQNHCYFSQLNNLMLLIKRNKLFKWFGMFVVQRPLNLYGISAHGFNWNIDTLCFVRFITNRVGEQNEHNAYTNGISHCYYFFAVIIVFVIKICSMFNNSSNKYFSINFVQTFFFIQIFMFHSFFLLFVCNHCSIKWLNCFRWRKCQKMRRAAVKESKY